MHLALPSIDTFEQTSSFSAISMKRGGLGAMIDFTYILLTNSHIGSFYMFDKGAFGSLYDCWMDRKTHYLIHTGAPTVNRWMLAMAMSYYPIFDEWTKFRNFARNNYYEHAFIACSGYILVYDTLDFNHNPKVLASTSILDVIRFFNIVNGWAASLVSGG